MRLYCATGNPGKLREFQLLACGFEIEVVPGYGVLPPCPETGATFEDNAIQKAMHYGPHAPGLLFADDSGLEVDALDGAPGVRSARYAGPGCDDSDNNRLLLENLRGIENRTARFVCSIALVEGAHVIATFRGAVEGRIIEGERGPNGFGYDPLFFYPPFGCTFGEASNESKSGVSHRGQAMRAMLSHLRGRQMPDASD